MVVNMELKLPKALGQWHLYHPEIPSMKEEQSYVDRKNILNKLNLFAKWMSEISTKANSKYQLMFSLKSISYNKIYSNELSKFFDSDIVVEHQDTNGAFLFALDNVFLKNLLSMYFGVEPTALGSFNFTDMEMVLIKSFYDDFFEKIFVEKGFLTKEAKVNVHTGKLNTMKYLSANQNFICIDFNCEFSNKSDTVIRLIYPEYNADDFLLRVNQKKEDEVFLTDNMKKGISADVAVQFGQAKLTFGEFMNVQKGDVVVLNNNIGDKIVFYIANQLKFLASVGQSGGRYAIQLEEQVFEEIESTSPKTTIREATKDEELLMDAFNKVNVQEEKEGFVSVLDEDDEDEEFNWEKL